MADEKKMESTITSGLDYASNINQFEQPPEERQKYIDAQKIGLKALEDRYKDPNWFKVAAGFAKPQLGGFIASLGSAADAMGENVENQRANQIPIYNARAQVAFMENKQRNLQKASEELVDALKSNDVQVLNDAQARQHALGNDRGVAAIKEKIATMKGATEQSNAVNAANARLINEQYLILTDPKSTDEQKNLANKKLSGMASTMNPYGKPADAPPAEKGVPPAGYGKEDILLPNKPLPSGASSATDQLAKNEDLVNAKTYAKSLNDYASKIQPRISNLVDVFPLFGDKGVNLVMGNMDNGQLSGIMKTALANQNVSGAAAAVAQLVSPTIEAKYPGTIDKIKRIATAAAQEQLNYNNAIEHPTLSTQKKEEKAAFSLDQPATTAARNVLVGIHDMATPLKFQPIVNRMVNEEGLPYSKVTNSSEYKDVLANAAKRRRLLSLGELKGTLPSDIQDLFKVSEQPKGKSIADTIRKNAKE